MSKSNDKKQEEKPKVDKAVIASMQATKDKQLQTQQIVKK